MTDARPSVAEATERLIGPGRPFEVVEEEIRGIRTRTWKLAPPSLRTVFDRSLLFGEADFLVYEDERLSFSEHYRMAATLGHRLQDELGVQKGDRVAIAMRNLPEWVVAFWGGIVAGATIVPLNAWWTGEELRYGLADSGASVLVADEERMARLAGHLPGLDGLGVAIVASADRSAPLRTPDGPSGVRTPMRGFGEFLGAVPDEATPPDVSILPEDDATIFYTSGTTGRPKGAVGTHRNACSNLMNLNFSAARSRLRSGKSLGDPPPAPSGQRSSLLSVPLFHATGCHAVMIASAALGSKLVMMHHFDPERALQLIERERINAFGGVPTIVMQVIDSPAFSKYDTSSVTSVSYGGAPAPPELVRRIRSLFPEGEPRNGYGLTETSAMTSSNTGADYVAKPDSCGPPVAVCEVAVVPEDFDGDEPEDHMRTLTGVTGELWIKGPNVVRGYWNKPEETAETFTRGWLRSGDLARLDDEGFIYIVDRVKDMVIRGGENVYCVEVENALSDHPAVAECAVIGVPHPVLGEEVGAVVVLRAGTKIAVDELTVFARERIAGYKVPTRVWFRATPLPRNPAGKALKRELRDEVLDRSGASGGSVDRQR
jgi:long-chain acyl-CoA synthetase